MQAPLILDEYGFLSFFLVLVMLLNLNESFNLLL